MTRKRKMTTTTIESTVPGVKCRMHNGSWTVFLAAGHSLSKKRRAISLNTTDPQLAAKKLEVTEAELVLDRRASPDLTIAGRSQARGAISVRQAVILFLEAAPARMAAESVALHTGHLTRWVLTSPIADEPILSVRPRAIRELLGVVRNTKNRYGRYNSRASARAVLTALRSMFAWLRDAEMLMDREGRPLPNPASGLDNATRHAGHDDGVAARFKPFLREEQAAMLKAAPHAWRCFLLLGLRAGLRIGEILALQVGDFDFAAKTIRVARRWTPQRGVLDGTKNKRGGTRVVRHVPFDLSPELFNEVRAQIARRQEENATKGWKDSSWLFVNRDGKVWHRSNFHTKIWQPLLERAGVARHVFHDTRHTFASELLHATNGNIDFVARCLGDHIAITATVYAHALEALKPRFAGVLDFAQAPDEGNVIKLDAARQ